MVTSKFIRVSGIIIFALTALISNINFYSTSFISKDRVSFSKDMDNTNSRQIASSNKELLSGTWSIYALLENGISENLEAEILLTPFEHSEIKVTFTNGHEEFFSISDESGFNLNDITLCRELNEQTTECIKVRRGGLQSLQTVAEAEAEKIELALEKETITASPPVKAIKGLKIDPDRTLYLYPTMAIDPKSKQNPVPKELVYGEMVIHNYVIEELDITVDDKSLRPADSNIPIKKGAIVQFKDIDGITNIGIINNNGSKETFSLRFSTGTLQGITIKFATAEAAETEERKAAIAQEEREATLAMHTDKAMFSDEAVLDRMYENAAITLEEQEQVRALGARNAAQREEAGDESTPPPTYFKGFKFTNG